VAPASESAIQPSHVRIGGRVRGAKLIHQVAPIYPASAKRNHVEGTVVLHGVVTKDGSVDQLQVVSGPAALTDAAIAAVKQWKYEPATFQDQPMEMATTVSIVFTLHRPEPPAAQALIRP
jgi:periplasmic protein TonB